MGDCTDTSKDKVHSLELILKEVAINQKGITRDLKSLSGSVKILAEKQSEIDALDKGLLVLTSDVKLLDAKVKALHKRLDTIEPIVQGTDLRDAKVDIVSRIVYGSVGLILLGVAGALLDLVLNKGH